jgi:hypothetical protein
MNHPRQRISDGSCHKQREQRVLCYSAGHDSLALVNVPFCLRVLFSCLAEVVLASPIYLMGCSGRLICNVVERLPDLIENMLG